MTEEVKKLIGRAEHALKVIVEPVASLKIEEGKAFISAIKELLGIL
jgi:hypothetical protein